MTKDADDQFFDIFQDDHHPIHEQPFVDRVSESITRQRVNQRKWLAIGTIIGLLLIIVLKSWLMATTSVISAITLLLTENLLSMMFSPIGYIVGGFVSLLVLIKVR